MKHFAKKKNLYKWNEHSIYKVIQRRGAVVTASSGHIQDSSLFNSSLCTCFPHLIKIYILYLGRNIIASRHKSIIELKVIK